MRNFRICLSFIILLGCIENLTAQSIEGLSKFHIEDRFFEINVFYNASTSEVINKDYSTPLAKRTRVLRTKISKESTDEYFIDYNSGVSADPSFSIYTIENGEEKPLFGVGGLEIRIPGDGNVYVSGHTNNMFNKRRKFTLKNGGLEEVIQPFYYVGLNTETTQEVTLLSNIDFKNPVITLAPGSKVEVLINKGEYYLVKTPYGITGWVYIFGGAHQAISPIKGIYYAGD